MSGYKIDSSIENDQEAEADWDGEFSEGWDDEEIGISGVEQATINRTVTVEDINGEVQHAKLTRTGEPVLGQANEPLGGEEPDEQ